MSIRNLQTVLDGLDSLPQQAKTLLNDSIREAGEVVAADLATRAPFKTGRLSRSINVWYSKKSSRQFAAAVFRIGLQERKNGKYFYPNFYAVLARGRKGKKGARPASHPGWKLPVDDTAAASEIVALAKKLFQDKLGQLEQMQPRSR